jgi:hypothetical protein
MDPCSIDDIVVPDYTMDVAKTVALLGIVAHFQTIT